MSYSFINEKYHHSDIYHRNVCNRYLDLYNLKLSEDEFLEILYCLTHQDQIHSAIRANVADFTNTRFYHKNHPEQEIYVTREHLPAELFNSTINFVFNH